MLVHEGYLLLGHVVLELALVLAAQLVEKVGVQEVIAYVAGVEGEIAVGLAQVAQRLRYLAVLAHLELVVDATYDAHLLVRVDLLDHLGRTVGVLVHAEADKDRIGELDKDVVHAVDVQVLDAASVHVVEDASLEERPVEAAVAVGRLAQLVLLVEYDLALRGQTRQHVLLEEDDVVGVEAEVAVGLEVVDGRLLRVLGRHEVPRNGVVCVCVCVCARRRESTIGELFDANETLGLQLIERLAREQVDRVHALGIGDAQACALTAGEQQHGHLVVGYGLEAVVLVCAELFVARLGVGALELAGHGQKVSIGESRRRAGGVVCLRDLLEGLVELGQVEVTDVVCQMSALCVVEFVPVLDKMLLAVWRQQV